MFFDRLRSFQKKGETDGQFANRLGISRQVWRNWKKGLNHVPKRKVFISILDILDITEKEFWCPCDRCDKGLQR